MCVCVCVCGGGGGLKDYKMFDRQEDFWSPKWMDVFQETFH
jgi:hypothetical protein